MKSFLYNLRDKKSSMANLKTCSCFLLIMILMLFSAYIVSAASIGVSPGTVHFKDVLRGGYSEQVVTITAASEESITANVSARGEIKDWLTFSENTFEVSKDKPYRLKIIAKPPVDMKNGDYEGIVRIVMEGFGKLPEGSMASVVKAAVDVKVIVTVTDQEITGCRARNFLVRSAEKGDPVEFMVDVFNDGNVRLRPHITIDVWNQEQTEMVKAVDFNDEEILPTVKDTVLIRVPTNDFDINQYWVEMIVEECVASDTLTFDVLEKGSLSAIGVLKQVASKVWAEVGETIPITAIFQNTGEKPVSAKFKGKIQLDDKIVQTLESDELSIPTNEVVNFEMFFKPEGPGRYIASGRVFYEKKRTFELSTIINVNPATEKKSGITIKQLLIYTAIFAVIAFISIKIRTERKKYKRMH